MTSPTEPDPGPPSWDDRPTTVAEGLSLLAAWGSLLAATVQLFWICGSPWIILFHASDAPSVSHPSRVDRLVLMLPAVLAIGLGGVGLRGRHGRGAAHFGVILAILCLLLVRSIGFS